MPYIYEQAVKAHKNGNTGAASDDAGIFRRQSLRLP